VPRLLDQVRDRIRVFHYSIRTEAVYLDWIKRYIRHFDKRHPGASEIDAFLTHLAVADRVEAIHKRRRRSWLPLRITFQ
jgi:hypothetical protein